MPLAFHFPPHSLFKLARCSVGLRRGREGRKRGEGGSGRVVRCLLLLEELKLACVGRGRGAEDVNVGGRGGRLGGLGRVGEYKRGFLISKGPLREHGRCVRRIIRESELRVRGSCRDAFARFVHDRGAFVRGRGGDEFVRKVHHVSGGGEGDGRDVVHVRGSLAHGGTVVVTERYGSGSRKGKGLRVRVRCVHFYVCWHAPLSSSPSLPSSA